MPIDPSRNSPDVVVVDLAVPGPHGPVPVRAYRPALEPVTSALLWAHGGGFGAGNLDMPEAHRVSGELARRAGAFVVSVDYRLAGADVRYPVPLDDVHAAWTWLNSPGPQTAGLDGVPFAIGGASAGAALALGTALRARDSGRHAVDGLLLAYPWVHFPVPALDAASTAAMAERHEELRFPPVTVEAMVRNYVGRITSLPAEALPGHAPLAGLPETHVVLCEYDDLRPSGELLQRQLAEVGVRVAVCTAEGMSHGHLNLPDPLPRVEESLDFFAGALRGLGRPPVPRP